MPSVEQIARALEAIDLAKKRCERKDINGDVRAALDSAKENLSKALTDLSSSQSDDRKFYNAILKYSLSKKAELGDNITEFLKFLGQK